MNQTEVLLSGIAYKVQLLLQKNKVLSEQLMLLEKKLKEADANNERLKSEVDVLKEKIVALETSQVLIAIDDKDNVHQKIDELVREIDKSINIFNRLE